MIDFTSSLYLGLKHESKSLPGWDQLTLGKPAALDPVPGSEVLEERLAELIGCERALLGPSTLHLFWDFFSVLAARGAGVFVDRGTYPIARWGAERAAALGLPVREFRHHDVHELEEMMKDARGPIVIVADGYCPSCDRAAPLAEYLELARMRDGLLVLDDTQALGIFGQSPHPWAPYGTGGGGSLKRSGVRDQYIVLASSLAKGFGAPIAVLSGSAAVLSEYETKSQTRVHCSPPSVAVTAAATQALRINQAYGDSLRLRLAQRVARFREWLTKLGMAGTRSLFPIQALRVPETMKAKALHETLLQCGVRAALHRGITNERERISFLVTAQHSFWEIDYAGACLELAVGCRTLRS